MFEIIPLSCTKVNWPAFLSAGKQLTGSTSNVKQDLGGYLLSLSELLTGSAKAWGVLRHVHVSFLVIGFEEFFRGVREETDLAISTTAIQAGHKAAVVSGTLDQWRVAIINCSSDRMSTEVRMLTNQFMTHFESSGLGSLWQGYSKSPMPDKTLKLLTK